MDNGAMSVLAVFSAKKPDGSIFLERRECSVTGAPTQPIGQIAAAPAGARRRLLDAEPYEDRVFQLRSVHEQLEDLAPDPPFGRREVEHVDRVGELLQEQALQVGASGPAASAPLAYAASRPAGR